MKKILIIVCTIALFSGCSESFLEKLPEDMLSPDIYYKNADDIKTGVVAIYEYLNEMYDWAHLPVLVERMSDDGTRPFGDSPFINHYKTNVDSEPYYWNNFYKMIVNANNIIAIIDKLEEVKSSEVREIKALRGEACFLRAFAYFNLARLYGDLPIFTEPWESPRDAFGVGRTPVNQVYTNVIIPDLEQAFADCYKKGDNELSGEEARATKGAALTLLGKAYLTINDHANVASTLKKLIVDKQAGNYELLTDFAQIFVPENKFNDESIFEVNYNVAAGKPSWYFRNMSAVGINVYKVPGSTSNVYAGTKDLMDEFYEHGEWLRMKESLDSGWHANNNLICPIPIKRKPPLDDQLQNYNNIGTDYNYMITRYADALLMYAEALMILGQKDAAATYVNQVRERAEMDPVSADDLDIEWILHERRMELCFEGHRWFDLVRTGKAVEYVSRQLMDPNRDYEFRVVRSNPMPEYQTILPIPVEEIQKDPTLTQNPGY